jgi:hypothetical protein
MQLSLQSSMPPFHPPPTLHIPPFPPSLPPCLPPSLLRSKT